MCTLKVVQQKEGIVLSKISWRGFKNDTNYNNSSSNRFRFIHGTK